MRSQGYGPDPEDLMCLLEEEGMPEIALSPLPSPLLHSLPLPLPFHVPREEAMSGHSEKVSGHSEKVPGKTPTRNGICLHLDF